MQKFRPRSDGLFYTPLYSSVYSLSIVTFPNSILFKRNHYVSIISHLFGHMNLRRIHNVFKRFSSPHRLQCSEPNFL